MKSYLILFIIALPFLGNTQFKEKKTFNGSVSTGGEIKLENTHTDRQNKSQKNQLTFDLANRSSLDQLNLNKSISHIKRINGKVRSIQGLPILNNKNTDTPIEQFFSYYADELKVTAHDVRVLESKTDADGQLHLKLEQLYKGIPIYGRQASLHGSDKGFSFYLGQFDKIEDVSIDPNISQEEIETLIRQQSDSANRNIPMPSGLEKILNQDPEINLVIYESEDGHLFLAYHAIFYPDGIHRKESIIDANSGISIKEFDSYCKFHNHDLKDNFIPPPDFGSGPDLSGQNQNFNTWREGSTYFLLDASRPMFNASASNMPNDPVGAIWTLTGNGQDPQSSNFGVSQITSNSSSWNDRTAISAHLNGSKSYEYYVNTFGRNSINGLGGTLVSILNAGAGNAFWNGQAIFYGNEDSSFEDLARGLDVAGHEMSHGVIQNTANLEYYGESGALNESFADIFGAMIDRDDWLIGEDVVKTNSFPSGALRNMMDPHNGGNGVQDLNRGWQPNRYSERFTGSEDNNGVHINSGISNRAYYLFASNANVGKSKAERVYYKVLDNYLTRSSDFADMRAALEQVVMLDFGVNTAEWNALQVALNTTQFPGGGGTIDNPVLESNPGDDFILLTTDTQEGIYIASSMGGSADQMATNNILSRPSVTDDGSSAVFINSDKTMQELVSFPLSPSVQTIQSNPIWRNVINSKDGNFVAALTDSLNNALYVFNRLQGSARRYELDNPTFTEGVSTGDVIYADAMEFSADGQFIIYDAINSIRNNTGENIEYWDIGFINVWDHANNQYGDGRIQKLFNQLPEDVSIGNPTFSKNSPNVIAFDLLEGSDWYILGMNIETNEFNTITTNNKIGYPSYSVDDRRIVFDHDDSDGAAIYFQGLDDTKIAGEGAFTPFFVEGAHWGVWYGTGTRVLSATEDLESDLSSFKLFPNPTQGALTVEFESFEKLDKIKIEIVNMLGQSMFVKFVENTSSFKEDLDINHLNSGIYYLNISSQNKQLTKSFIKSQ